MNEKGCDITPATQRWNESKLGQGMPRSNRRVTDRHVFIDAFPSLVPPSPASVSQTGFSTSTWPSGGCLPLQTTHRLDKNLIFQQRKRDLEVFSYLLVFLGSLGLSCGCQGTGATSTTGRGSARRPRSPGSTEADRFTLFPAAPSRKDLFLATGLAALTTSSRWAQLGASPSVLAGSLFTLIMYLLLL